MSFRTNFILRCVLHVVWFAFFLAFFEVLFRHVRHIGDWGKYPYLLFQGTCLLLNSLVSALFLNNLVELAERIRTGDLDTALLRPVNEQFLLTCRRVDWALTPQVLLGVTLVGSAASKLEVPWSAGDVAAYVFLLAAGLAVLYSLGVAFAAAGIWLVGSETLFELWFWLMDLARLPADCYLGEMPPALLRAALLVGIPVLVAVNVPARFGSRLLETGWEVVLLILCAAVGFLASRWLFRRSLRSYQSAGG